MRLKTTLEQWLTLSEIDKAGSIQAAAVALNKSHTTLIYAVKKLEEQLGVTLIKVVGRRAVLTDEGKSLLRRAQSMLEQAKALEQLSTQIAQGVESQLVVAIDHLCDRAWLYQPMAEFFELNNATSVQVVETSLSKTSSMVTEELADISIITLPITNYPSESFAMVNMFPVVAKHHALASIVKPCLADLAANRQIVIRDLGHALCSNTRSDSEALKDDGKNRLKEKISGQHNQDVGWLKSNQRITVDNFDHAWDAVKLGVGYSRLPKHVIDKYNDENVVILDIEHAHSYQVPLHLTLPKGAKTGPAAMQLYQLLVDSMKSS